jgi:DNA-binding response OmpR family regulator
VDVDQSLPLTAAQRRVLDALVRREGRVARREDIYREAFGRPLPDGSRAIDVHVARIRRVIGERSIVTVGRVGYRFEASAVSSNGDGTDRSHA